MKFLQIENSKVTSIHHMPFDSKYGLGLSREELEKVGVLVETIPEPEQSNNKVAVLYCDPQTKELWYEYEDIPLTTEEEELMQLKLELKQTQEALDFLIMTGGI